MAFLFTAWLAAAPFAYAQQTPQAPANQSGSTTVNRSGGDAVAVAPATLSIAEVRLEALLTSDGQHIDQGLIWRVFSGKPGQDGKPKLVATHREASPSLKIAPGDYTVNVAFGRANLTRKITVKTTESNVEQFVLNAGGLRVTADIGGTQAPANAITYTIQSDERDQFGNRPTIMTGARPGLIIRLNAGIYQLTSIYGDANAIVRADITVEAGKLTEAALSHAAGKVAFKLVTEPGGDAVPDTQWSIQTPAGEIVKESVGALPTHILAPGTYAAFAKKAGKSYRRDFMIRPGDVVQVEVVAQ
ncbi:MAG: hypothetical protein ABL901_11370 [Hyphomicrobiaceae bacterium]